MTEWISVQERLPESPHKYGHHFLVWVNTGYGKAGGYRDTAAFGEYLCEMEDPDTNDLRYVVDNDDGNWKGSGWHREEDAHGGPYDTVFVDLNDKVTHWMPLPEPPWADQ